MKSKMSKAAREARNAYNRKYNHEHPEKVRQWQEAYWERRIRRESAAKQGNEAEDAEKKEAV